VRCIDDLYETIGGSDHKRKEKKIKKPEKRTRTMGGTETSEFTNLSKKIEEPKKSQILGKRGIPR